MGPVPKGQVAILPFPFSAKENCTVCTEAVSVGIATVPDVLSYENLRATLIGVCNSHHLKSFSYPGPAAKCKTNYQPACRILMNSMLEQMMDHIWELFADFYTKGLLPDKVCEKLAKCSSI